MDESNSAVATAVDVTVWAEVLSLLKDWQKRYQMAVILITHDLELVCQTSDQVSVMRYGEILEEQHTAPRRRLPERPASEF